MLGFVQNWLSPRPNPIGVDFGSTCLRLAQVQVMGNEYHLIAAASADVPREIGQDVNQRIAWFAGTVRQLLSQGGFRGRQAVLGLPSAWMHIQHLRLPRMDDEAIKKAIAWESQGKLPIDPAHALMRHLVAGDICIDQEPQSEVILMAAARERINQFLAAAGKGKLDVVGMNVEPKVIVDCFARIYRRATDAEATSCYVDIGASATRAVIAYKGRILFARSIPIGGDHFTQVVADEMETSPQDARMLRVKYANTGDALSPPRRVDDMGANHAGTGGVAERDSFALLNAATENGDAHHVGNQAVATDGRSESSRVRLAVTPLRIKLTEELELCRRYYESTFSSRPVDRLIFVGGESRQRELCQEIARSLGLAAQVGDPLVRMSRASRVAIASGIDRRQTQPGWTVAIGLSMGPAIQGKDEDEAENTDAAMAGSANDAA